MNPVMIIRSYGEPEVSYLLWCPGCDDLHRITTRWSWDGNADAPTFSPSILVTGGTRNIICHSFIKEGVWDFLSDSTHLLAGAKVPMVPLPDWIVHQMDGDA